MVRGRQSRHVRSIRASSFARASRTCGARKPKSACVSLPPRTIANLEPNDARPPAVRPTVPRGAARNALRPARTLMRCAVLASVVVSVLVTAAQPAPAQQPKDAPRRPQLPAGVDTNNARVYYDFGIANLERDPEAAADAFYWATRINPVFADAFYARRCALLLTDKIRFQKYVEDDRGTLRSDEIKRIDSLYYVALTINPFIYRGLDARLFRKYLNDFADDFAMRNNVSAQYVINPWLMDAPVAFKAWRAYGEDR